MLKAPDVKTFILYSCVLLTSILLLACSEQPEGNLPDLNLKPVNVVRFVPDFAKIKNVSEKKAGFFSFLSAMAVAENAFILKQRAALDTLRKKHEKGVKPLAHEKQWLSEIASLYRIKAPVASTEYWHHASRRVDVIPVSLLLAQGALESAWGTSRFAQKANNLFGQWCFKTGCGLVPLSRNVGTTHEVAKFITVNAAIRAYLLNLNRLNTYQQLRLIREQLRQANKPLTGKALAAGLERYSERGEEYIKEIRSVINYNKLEVFNIPLAEI